MNTTHQSKLYCAPDPFTSLVIIFVIPGAAGVIAFVIARWFLRKRMRRWMAEVLSILVTIAVGFAALVGGSLYIREDAKISCCQSNLHQFDLALGQYGSEHDGNYPSELTELSPDDVSPVLYVCPGAFPLEMASTVAEAGPTASYIYVAGLSWENTEGIPLLLCPPINHGGESGNVLWSDHSTRSINKEEFDKLYATLSTNENVWLVVSESLSERSGGEYVSTLPTIRVAPSDGKSASSRSQAAAEPISLNLDDVELKQVLDLFARFAEVDIVYDTNDVTGVLVEVRMSELEWFDALAEILQQVNFTIEQDAANTNQYRVLKVKE